MQIYFDVLVVQVYTLFGVRGKGFLLLGRSLSSYSFRFSFVESIAMNTHEVHTRYFFPSPAFMNTRYGAHSLQQSTPHLWQLYLRLNMPNLVEQGVPSFLLCRWQYLSADSIASPL